METSPPPGHERMLAERDAPAPSVTAPALRSDAKPNYLFIDCVRGYAIFLVMIVHLRYRIPEMPYPVGRTLTLGWYSVQLFFLASCVTLLMSWQYEARKGPPDIGHFFLRQFFRIAPAYYAAALLFFFVTPPRGGFDPLQLLASFAFVNAWHPLTTPTVPTAWTVVPGGWNIGVEFTFYFLFPLFAAWVIKLKRAVIAVAAALVIALVLDPLVWPLAARAYGPVAADNFIYFWFPHQAVVFALGSVVFHAIVWLRRPEAAQWRADAASHGSGLIVLAILLCVGLTRLPAAPWLSRSAVRPGDAAGRCVMAVFLLLMSEQPRGFWNNIAVAWLGQVSFSAYLLHDFVLDIGERYCRSDSTRPVVAAIRPMRSACTISCS